ncbi:hypothetical protein Tco_0185343 [Tanacetum coccineum]
MILSPGQPIPYGRPYRYHLNGPVHMMTARKRVGPLPTHRLAVRHSTDHSSSDSSLEFNHQISTYTSSDSSSRHPLSDHPLPDLPSTSARPSRKRYVEVDPREIKIDDCIEYADAHRYIGIDARVVVEAPAQKGAIEATYETLGDLVQRFHDHTQAIPVHRIQAIKDSEKQGHSMVGLSRAVYCFD